MTDITADDVRQLMQDLVAGKPQQPPLAALMREADACAHEPRQRIPPCRAYDLEPHE